MDRPPWRRARRQKTQGLHLSPITLREAWAVVDRHHRHHRAPRSLCLFAVAVAVTGAEEPCGVAVIGRPVSRELCDGYTAEVRRVCVVGEVPNACSKLYGAAWRAARALGYLRLVTYTLPEEGGASLRGAGWRIVGECGGGAWSRQGRPRVDDHPQQIKIRWERP